MPTAISVNVAKDKIFPTITAGVGGTPASSWVPPRAISASPNLAGGGGVFTEDGEAFADAGTVGVGVRLLGVSDHGGGLAGEGGGENAVAGIGLGAAAGSDVVRGAADRDRDASGVVGGEQVARHPPAELAFLGVGVVGAVLGERTPGGASVQVDVSMLTSRAPVASAAASTPACRAGNCALHSG